MKTQAQAMAEMKQYVSRDLKDVIVELLKQYRIKAKPQLVDDIYDLVMVESTDVYARSVHERLETIIENVMAKGGTK